MSSEYNHLDPLQFRKGLSIINRIIEILGEFKNNYNKKLNFTKLVTLLQIPKAEIGAIVSLLLNFQEKFESIFMNYSIKKLRENGQIYLTVEERIHIPHTQIPPDIILSKSQIELYNDLIYTFRYIKKGKGFDILNNATELSTQLKKLIMRHPYLFETRENGLIYPSEIGLKLGTLILSYNKSNRQFDKLKIDNYQIIVRNDG